MGGRQSTRFCDDAEGLYLPTPLMGFTLVDDAYVAITADDDGGIRSSVLGLDFRLRDGVIAIYDPIAGEWVQTRAETAEARAEQESTRAETAEARAEQESIARENAETRAEQESIARENAETRAEQESTRAETAEAEAAQLREEIARLKANKRKT